MERILDAFSGREIEPPAKILTWEEADRLVRTLPPKTNLVIPKSHLESEPLLRATQWGRGRGALRQYRDARGHQSLHVKEFDRHWVLHIDMWNPLVHTLRHLAVDRGFKTFLHLLDVLAPARPAATPA